MKDYTTTEHEQYRLIIESQGVSPEILTECEKTNGAVDWRALTYAMDNVFLSHGGAMGQHLFFISRHMYLDGMTALEALPTLGGPERVQEAARRFAFERYER